MTYKKYNNKKNISSNSFVKKYLKKMIVQVLICVILVLSTLIVINKSTKARSIIKENVYQKNISFASFNELYKKYFGSNIPFSDKIFKEQTVFNEKLSYKNSEKYLDGVSLEVENKYLIPILESGIVVYTGEKEGYNNIVIIQTTSGMDIWYGNVDNLNVKLYDYVEKGNLLGEVKDNKLYLVFQKDGKYLDYQDYLKNY